MIWDSNMDQLQRHPPEAVVKGKLKAEAGTAFALNATDLERIACFRFPLGRHPNLVPIAWFGGFFFLSFLREISSRGCGNVGKPPSQRFERDEQARLFQGVE